MKYLAVLQENGEHYIEDSASAVAYAIANNLTIKYYAIRIDPETLEPSLSLGPVSLEEAPRPLVERKTFSLQAGGEAVAEAETIIEPPPPEPEPEPEPPAEPATE